MKISSNRLLALSLTLTVIGVAIFAMNPARKQKTVPTVERPASTPAKITEPPPTVLGSDDEHLFSDIGNLEKGSLFSLPLPDGGRIEGRINYSKIHPNNATAAGGELADGSGTFEIAREPWGYRGFILPKAGKIAHVYSSDPSGKLQVAARPRGEIICEPDPNFKPPVQAAVPDPEKAAIYNGGRSVGIIFEAIPVLHSLPRAAACIYLDFDGEVIEGQSWEGGRRIIASAYNLPANEVTDMWRRVAEDFEPFEVNVTTDLQAYLRAPQGRRMRCIVTPSNFAPGAGGIAFGGTFLESGDTCCWVFMTGKAGTDAISHEIGHTLGLHHDGRGTDGYFGGHGSGATNWGPIMGAPYGATVAQWSKGDYVNANQQQDDLLVMGSYIPRRLDDHAATAARATPLKLGAAGAVSNTGIIDSPDDLDAFTFTTGGGTLNLTFNGAVNSPNLDIEVKLYNAAGTLVSTASPANQLNTSLSLAVAAGTYSLTVDGTGNATWATNGYDDYGSLGAYTITGTVPSPAWTFQVAANALNGTVLGTTATGSAFSITAGNTGNAFSINATTGAISVATAAALTPNTTFNLTVAYSGGTLPVTITVVPIRGVKQEIWTGLGGNGIGPLTSLAAYPNSPNQVRHSPAFQTTLDLDNYGQKLSGYLLPTETGNHVFWSSSDDYSEVWLSTDATPANKVKIITLSNVTGAGAWTAVPSQESAPIPLTAGQRYYMEVLHRDQTGPDQLSVAWQSPTQDRRLIPMQNLEHPGTWVNLAPWIAKMTYRVREDATVGTTIATLVAGDSEPGSVLSSFAITGGNTGNAFALNATTGVLTVNGALSFATLQKYLLDISVTDSGGKTGTAQIAVEVEARAVKRQLWTGINGSNLSDLTTLGTYPNNPNSTTYQAFFETPTNSADNYGQKLSGYLRAPDSGSFTFWIAADDACELWLSTDSNPANKVKIAYSLTWTDSRQWGKFTTQKSAAITLEGGKFYYIEALQKEGIGGDNLAVSWSGPDFGQIMLGAPNVTQQFYNHAAPVLNDRNVTVYNRDDIVTTLEAKDWADPGTQVTYSITGGNADGAFTIDPLTGVIRRNTILLPVGTRVLTVTATDNGPTPLSDTGLITVQVLKAGLKREVWTGLSGGQALTELTGSLYYPHTPDLTGYTENFQAPSGFGDNYGQRLSGHLVPPATGNYTFWIASDDGGELWISSDANPANKRKISSVTGSVNALQWNAQASQQSVGIPLEAGQSYYIEALQKEGGGGDHLAVAWQGPSIAQAVIPSTYLEYPETFRPGLRREFFNSSSATKWANNPASGQMQWTTATANYTETFAGTGALNGNTTETGTGTWGSSTGWVRNNGVATKSATGDAHALLPFLPQPGYVYTLSLEIDPTNSPGSADWFALGFTNDVATNTALYTQASLFPSIGQSWMLARANGSDGGTMTAFASATTNPISASPTISPVGAYDTLSVMLDTRNSAWVSTYYMNGTLLATHNHAGALTIKSAGFSSYRNAVGNVRNFRLTSTGGGAPGSLFSLKSANLGEENFSERLTGFIIPPATGAYTFWIASDDDGQLLLSTDENPANLESIASITGHTAEEAWDTYPSQQSSVKQLVAGKRYYFQVNHRDGVFGDHVAVAWQGPGITRRVIANAHLEPPAAPADRTLVNREVWGGIAGDNVSDLTGSTVYPASPTTIGTLTAGTGWVSPTNTADTFGERVSGYLVAPDDGRYTFWIASDKSSELWLSTDENPANRIRIASVSGWVAAQAWDTQPSQKSVPIALVSGKRYYLEALHKEGTGTDHLAVAWQGPSFTRRVIANSNLENPLVMPGKPSLKREVWTGITGTTVSSLTSAASFTTGKPTARGVLTTFESPTSYADNFGERVTGYLVPPETGNYKFWIAANDSAELWLSTDSNPANRMKIGFNTAVTAARTWTTFATQESGWLTLTAGQRYHIEVLHKEGTLVDHMAVAWQGPSFSRQIIDGRFLEYPGTIPDPVFLKREVWTGIGGNNVTDLTNTAAYPATPNQTSTLNTFETPTNTSDNYGQKVSGYLIAPVTGDYQFWIASDDGGEFWLSTSDVQANKTKIAYTTGATGLRDWTNNVNQASVIIPLTAGQRCYVEALHKEGGGEDYLGVAWQGPGFSQQIIGGPFLEYPGLPSAETQAATIIPATGIDHGYTFWLAYMGLQGNDRLANADPDGDEIPNSLEFILGGLPSGAGANSISLLPKITTDATWAIFEFRRADISLTVDPFAQFGTTLGAWSRANNGVGGVQITTVDDGFAPGVDRVTVRVPRAGNPRLFLRLNSNMK
ncbi:MAG: PA14 domain-containing protein [Verrucomicrobiota bacterium]